MIRLISSDGFKDINYEDVSLEIEPNKLKSFEINAYFNVLPEDHNFCTLCTCDTMDKAIEELKSLHVQALAGAKSPLSYIRMEDRLEDYSSRNRKFW